MKRIILLSLMGLYLSSYGQIKTELSVSAIADSLKEQADVVNRLDDITVDITSPSHYIEKVHSITTLLKNDGLRYLRQSYGFNKYSKINDIEVTVYNSAGAQIKKYRKKDFESRNAFDGFSLATDDKVMELTAASAGLPCTVEINLEREVYGYINLPGSYFNYDRESTEKFHFQVSVPSNLDIRHKEVNIHLDPVVTTNGDKKVYVWETSNLKVKRSVSGGFEAAKYLPQILIAPNEFEYDGHKGAFKSWKDFGAWNYALYQEGTPFSNDRMQEIKTIVDTITDLHQKIAALYSYMQNNVRYVSIQFGIGGFKPFTAKFVDETKYGDCKALSNYMRNLLAVAGIRSYPALINAGSNKIPADPSFPNDVFNHVILCVPTSKDTVWLECTSNSNKPGFLGSFTENRNALLLTENGGVLVPTPKSSAANNQLTIHTDINVNEDGSAQVHTKFYASGDIYFHFTNYAKMETEEQKSLFTNYFNYKDFEDYQLGGHRDSAQGEVFELNLDYGKLYDFNAGNKYFFPQHINRICNISISPQDDRQSEFLFEYPYEKRDTTVFHLTKGYWPDQVPAVQEIKNEYASYRRSVTVDKDKKEVVIVSVLILSKRVLPRSDLQKAAYFFNQVNKDEDEKIIFNKVESKDAAALVSPVLK